MDIVNYYADLGIEDDHADEVAYDWCTLLVFTSDM